jgi:hypothetical protein
VREGIGPQKKYGRKPPAQRPCLYRRIPFTAMGAATPFQEYAVQYPYLEQAYRNENGAACLCDTKLVKGGNR